MRSYRNTFASDSLYYLAFNDIVLHALHTWADAGLDRVFETRRAAVTGERNTFGTINVFKTGWSTIESTTMLTTTASVVMEIGYSLQSVPMRAALRMNGSRKSHVSSASFYLVCLEKTHWQAQSLFNLGRLLWGFTVQRVNNLEYVLGKPHREVRIPAVKRVELRTATSASLTCKHAEIDDVNCVIGKRTVENVGAVGVRVVHFSTENKPEGTSYKFELWEELKTTNSGKTSLYLLLVKVSNIDEITFDGKAKLASFSAKKSKAKDISSIICVIQVRAWFLFNTGKVQTQVWSQLYWHLREMAFSVLTSCICKQQRSKRWNLNESCNCMYLL